MAADTIPNIKVNINSNIKDVEKELLKFKSLIEDVNKQFEKMKELKLIMEIESRERICRWWEFWK
jgi:hypothetical protein